MPAATRKSGNGDALTAGGGLNVESLLNTALEIEEERKDVMKRQIKNREILRLLADNGALNDEALMIVNRVYPKRIKGVRLNGANGKALSWPVYSQALPELEGQPVTREDMVTFGLDPENFTAPEGV